ncbi:Tripartite-type tricarboxylate transporter, receptor component TctC [Polaromonas sp. YR568]|uniref:Bug family tripartite tricarboxylate transporter substrate binding protein n=1 Tax=Polaromonas sp. YR568 TaxID=1855301 RepID=UPI0008E3BC6C|nr:tripartite tricarboxylate transporter substrate binding protein [Polaromonas sp. YR568]SFU97443.1 Tripartite-type tricarboxylate transporter, receptor component TctC [Polaromonas sp. YR568]
MKLLFSRSAFLVLLLAAASFDVAAQTYPTKPLHVIAPFPPGGPVDVLGRVLAQGLSDAMGQPAIVENKVGAAGNIGIEQAAKAAPDGYTMAIVPLGNIAVNPALYPNLPYKTSDLAPVTMLATVENVLVVNAAVPARSVKELLALAAQKPGSISFASPGAGSQAHLAGELMGLNGGVQLLHVPYKGIGPALNDLLGGQVSMMFAQMSSVLPHIKSGKLRALGVASLKRSPVMPDTPTIAEQGLPRFEAVSWYALMVPAGTPRAVVDKLNAETGKLFATPALKEKLAALGMDAATGRPSELAAAIQADTQRWTDVIRQKNIKPE